MRHSSTPCHVHVGTPLIWVPTCRYCITSLLTSLNTSTGRYVDVRRSWVQDWRPLVELEVDAWRKQEITVRGWRWSWGGAGLQPTSHKLSANKRMYVCPHVHTGKVWSEYSPNAEVTSSGLWTHTTISSLWTLYCLVYRCYIHWTLTYMSSYSSHSCLSQMWCSIVLSWHILCFLAV